MSNCKHSVFPDHSEASEDGLLCVGGSFDIDLLIDAYSNGIFPWPQPGLPILWYSPPKRGIIDFDKLHISERLKRYRKKRDGDMRIDTSFRLVMQNCMDVKRKGQNGTWILPEMIDGYCNLFNEGYAHCVEAWEASELVAGIYGVYINNVFSAESMFFKKPNISKLCLLYLIDHLQNLGLTWMDVQVVTNLTESFGAYYISRNKFLKMINVEKQKKRVKF